MDFHYQKINEQWRRNRFLLDYYHVLEMQANKVAFHYPFVPLGKEDLINSALFELPDILTKFDPGRNTDLTSYIAFKVYYFMMNYARSYTNKNNQIMNSYVEFEKCENHISLPNYSPTNNAKELMLLPKIKMSDFEMLIFCNFFVKKHTITRISQYFMVSNKTISNAIHRIRRKFRQVAETNATFS